MADQTRRDVEDVVSALNREPTQSDAPSAESFSEWYERTEKIPISDIGVFDYKHTVECAEAYAALRTAQQDAKYQNQILIANDWKNIATSNSSTLGQQALLIDELKARAEAAESALSEARERTIRECAEEAATANHGLTAARKILNLLNSANKVETSSASATGE